MPSATTSIKTATSDPLHVDDVDAYSIPEFCRRHGICRGTYYNMKANRTAPREFRAMGRVLFAGDIGSFAYAGQLGVHIRPRDDARTRPDELSDSLAAGSSCQSRHRWAGSWESRGRLA